MPAQKTHGFTLVELMIAVAIIAIISAVGITSFNQSQKIGRDARRKQDLRSLAVALELFYQKNGRYPCATTATTSTFIYNYSSNWLTDLAGCTGGTGQAMAPTFISKMPTDPLSSGSIYYYGYLGFNNAHWSCAAGSYYILHTILENDKDPDALGTKSISHCGGTISTAQGYRADAFVIAAP